MKPIAFALFCLCLVVPLNRPSAAPTAELWPRWQAHDANATIRIDHSAWDAFLKRYVVPGPDGLNRVAYGRVAGDDRRALAGYIESLSRTPVSRLNRLEQFAYWVNLYNALTVDIVVQRYPVASIRDISISPGLFASGPWGKKLATVEGEPVSLDDIEHRILRPIWRDPRIHYAVNCASVGCPNLLPKAFTAETAEALLDEGARAYVNHPRGAEVVDRRLIASSIYDWYQADFGGSEAGVIQHLARHAGPQLGQALLGVRGVSEYRYDWGLNDAR